MSFKLDEEILKKALLLELEERMNGFPASFYEPHAFSKKFIRRMAGLKKRAARPRPMDRTIQRGKRAAVVLLAALITVLATIMSVGAFRQEFFRFMRREFPEYSQVFYNPIDPDKENPMKSRFIAYVPTYIPEGFTLVDENRRNQVLLRYERSGQYIMYRQIAVEKTRMVINTENVILENIEVNGYAGYYCSNIGDYTIIWDDGIYSYLVSTNIDKRTAIKIAESIKMEK